jgi:hypothetical protein
MEKTYLGSWRTLPQPWKGEPFTSIVTNSFKRPFHYCVKPTASGCWRAWQTFEFHECGPISSLFFSYKVSSLIRSKAVWKTMMIEKASVSPQVLILAKALQAEKEN